MLVENKNVLHREIGTWKCNP